MGKGNMVIKRPKAKISATASLSPSALSRWINAIEKETRKFKKLSHALIKLAGQLFRNMLSCGVTDDARK